MSSAGGGAPFGADDRVYRAVAAGASLDEVRRAIEQSQSSVAAVNQAGPDGETPLKAAYRIYRRDLLCLLLENGADGAGHDDEFDVVCWCVEKNNFAGLRRLIERGVSVNVSDHNGDTPLIHACLYSPATADRRDLTLEIFRRSSAETRRVAGFHGWSAVDCIIAFQGSLQPWQTELIGELLAAGAPVLPHNAPRVVPIAAARAARRDAELVAFQFAAHDWRAQETFAGLSMDMSEMREAQLMVAERRARLQALERELGSGTDSGSSNGSESESEEGEEDEATGSGGAGE